MENAFPYREEELELPAQASVIEANRKLAMMLKHEKNFLYESLGEENQGLYLNPIIQKSINMLWFSDLQDEGPQYPLVFGPNGMLPIYAIAFILTVIECGIDMWLTGIKKDITFQSSQYRGVYMTHIDLLLKYEKGTQELDLLNKLRRRLYRRAAISAGVNLPSDNPRPIIPASAYTNAMQQHKENPQESEIYMRINHMALGVVGLRKNIFMHVWNHITV
ncbi:hypothetical protein BD779DRAFT_1477316 [Infundibulicybe gibba]|nr:hypothetical protein BD779DRAFT_1477316 [Infundibulicybe gibba]